MEPDDSAALIRSLIIIAAHQQTINDDLRLVAQQHEARLEALQALHNDQVAINGRLEQLLARMIPPSPNGHED